MSKWSSTIRTRGVVSIIAPQCPCNRFAIGERRKGGLHALLNVGGGVDLNLLVTGGNLHPDSVDDCVTQTVDANAGVVCHFRSPLPLEYAGRLLGGAGKGNQDVVERQ